MRIDHSLIEKIADLARLELSEEEVAALARDCQAILDYFEEIRHAEAGSPELPFGEGRATPTRADGETADTLLRPLPEGAPAWRDGYFVLPRLAALDADGFDDAG